jgi:hypothetical protein
LLTKDIRACLWNTQRRPRHRSRNVPARPAGAPAQTYEVTDLRSSSSAIGIPGLGHAPTLTAPPTFSGLRGRTSNICSACLLELAFVSWIRGDNASNATYVKPRNAATSGPPRADLEHSASDPVCPAMRPDSVWLCARRRGNAVRAGRSSFIRKVMVHTVWLHEEGPMPRAAAPGK